MAKKQSLKQKLLSKTPSAGELTAAEWYKTKEGQALAIRYGEVIQGRIEANRVVGKGDWTYERCHLEMVKLTGLSLSELLAMDSSTFDKYLQAAVRMIQGNSSEEYLGPFSQKEAAAQADVSPRTIRRWVDLGDKRAKKTTAGFFLIASLVSGQEGDTKRT